MSGRGLVVVGASYAGAHAAISAREAGYSERITIVGAEEWLPYERPPLSKAFLLGDTTEEKLILRDRGFFRAKDIDLVLGISAVSIDRSSKEVHLKDGTRLGFHKLLVGTGSRARRLELPGADLDGVCYLRSMNDAIELRQRLRAADDVVVIGGGFIGLETAASAIKLGKKITLVEAAGRLLERAVSPLISGFLLEMHHRNGVEIRLNETVRSIDGVDGKVTSVTCAGGARLGADLVLVGIGGTANDELARSAQLACTDGIVVDERGCTDDPDILAAGDCANQFNPFAQASVRLESVQNALDQASAAGAAIAGRAKVHASVPRFWSDQYECKLQTVGFSRGFDTNTVRNSVESGKFSVFYYKAGQLIGVESINSPGDQLISRRLIGAGRTPTREQAADASFDLRTLA